MQQNTFRYNLSVNDGIDDYAGITVWGESAPFVKVRRFDNAIEQYNYEICSAASIRENAPQSSFWLIDRCKQLPELGIVSDEVDHAFYARLILSEYPVTQKH